MTNPQLRSLVLLGWLALGLSTSWLTPVSARKHGNDVEADKLLISSQGSSVSSITVEGEVQRFLHNSDGLIDGLILSDGKQIGFSTALAKEILPAVNVGDRIHAQVEPGVPSPYGQNFHLNSLTTKSGTKIEEESSLDRPFPNSTGQPLSAEGQITKWLVDQSGEIRGFLLSDGTQVHCRPSVGNALPSHFKPNDHLVVKGYGSRTDSGACFDAIGFVVNGKPVSLYELSPYGH